MSTVISPWEEQVSDATKRALKVMGDAHTERITKGMHIVLEGAVTMPRPCSDEVAMITSSDSIIGYRCDKHSCTCEDFKRGNAPHGWCKHRFARAIYIRAHALRKIEQHTDYVALEPDSGCWIPVDEDGTPCHATDSTCTHAAAPEHKEASMPTTFPEAPASVNVRVLVRGRECQFTLRDMDERRLLQRLHTFLEQFPTEAQSTIVTPHAPAPQSAPICQYHGAMKASAKAAGTWYCPAKMGDGSYCKSRG